MKKTPARILIGLAINGCAFVVATDNNLVEWECDEISPLCEDLGIDWLDGYLPTGYCLWEGTVGTEAYFNGDNYEPETVYKGTLRQVELHELPELLSMEPPTEDDQ